MKINDSPKEILLSGGGTNAMTIIGVLDVLYNNSVNSFDNVKKWVGASAGSMIAIFMCLGYTPQSMYKLLYHCDYTTFNNLTCDMILGYFDSMGVITADPIVTLIELALEKKGYTRSMTFRELFDHTQKELGITGYNMTKGITEYFSYKTTPTMEIRLASKISISVPFVFCPVRYNGSMYVDGGLFEHTPARFCTDPKHALIIEYLSKQNQVKTFEYASNLYEFCEQLLCHVNLFVYKKNTALNRIKKKHPQSVISVFKNTKHAVTLDFSSNHSQKEELFQYGRQCMIQKMNDTT